MTFSCFSNLKAPFHMLLAWHISETSENDSICKNNSGQAGFVF